VTAAEQFAALENRLLALRVAGADDRDEEPVLAAMDAAWYQMDAGERTAADERARQRATRPA